MIFDRIKPAESIGFLSYKVSRLLSNSLGARFAEAGLGLTVEQWATLVPIAKHNGITQGRLCEIISQEKTGVSRLLAALERRGLVERKTSKSDRRVKHIFITPEGERLMESSLDLALANKVAAAEGIDPDELAICCKVLLQIIRKNGGCQDYGCEG